MGDKGLLEQNHLVGFKENLSARDGDKLGVGCWGLTLGLTMVLVVLLMWFRRFDLKRVLLELF